jgi:hypothetical protein
MSICLYMSVSGRLGGLIILGNNRLMVNVRSVFYPIIPLKRRYAAITTLSVRS